MQWCAAGPVGLRGAETFAQRARYPTPTPTTVLNVGQNVAVENADDAFITGVYNSLGPSYTDQELLEATKAAWLALTGGGAAVYGTWPSSDGDGRSMALSSSDRGR